MKPLYRLLERNTKQMRSDVGNGILYGSGAKLNINDLAFVKIVG